MVKRKNRKESEGGVGLYMNNGLAIRLENTFLF